MSTKLGAIHAFEQALYLSALKSQHRLQALGIKEFVNQKLISVIDIDAPF